MSVRFIRTWVHVTTETLADGRPYQETELVDPPAPGARDIDVRFKGSDQAVVIWKVES